MSDEQVRNERERRKRDLRRVWQRTFEQQARQQLRRLDNWMIREAIRQGVWEK